EGTKTPFEQPACVVAALLGRGITGDDGDQASAVLLGRSNDAVTRLLGEAGFETVDTRHQAEQWIAVDEPMLEIVELLQREEIVESGGGADDIARKHAKLARRHLMAGVVHPGGIRES